MILGARVAWLAGGGVSVWRSTSTVELLVGVSWGYNQVEARLDRYSFKC
jgi:hypothetical protein